MIINMIKLSNGKGITFKNLERIDERIIYEAVKGRIESLSQAKHIKDIMGPSEDVSIWEIEGNEIRIIFDFDYGVEVLADTEDTINTLIELLKEPTQKL